MAVLAVTALAAGCRLGPGAYRHATDPEGVSVTITMAQGSIGGELLEATQEGVLVLSGGSEIHSVPYAAVRKLEVAQFRDLGWSGDRPPSGRSILLLRRISRFPQGTTPELRRQLLEAYGRTEIRNWGE
jgi:hypothetical protein